MKSIEGHIHGFENLALVVEVLLVITADVVIKG